MAERLEVHVASRSPSIVSQASGTGEFEWRHSRLEAACEMAKMVVRYGEAAGVNLALTTIEVPANLDAGGITAYIDANWHLIEVALQSD